MPKQKLPHLHHEKSRNGLVWYVRVGHGKRTRVKEEYGTAEFFRAYQAALGGVEFRTATGRKVDTLEHLIEQYRKSSEFGALKSATRKQRWNFYRGTIKEAADVPYTAIERDHIVDGRERRAKTPSQANNWLDAMRMLFKWAVEHNFLKSDPTEGVKNVRRPKSNGFIPWTEADVLAFEKRWPIGTRERLALSVFLYVGLRRGDAAMLGPSNMSDGVIYLETEKTGQPIILPAHPELTEIIERSPIGATTFIARRDGSPMVKEGLGNWFREACEAAGVRGSAHGIRKLAATRLVGAGATEAQLEAAMGWREGSGMSRVYTRTRDRAKLARQAMEKLLEGRHKPARAGDDRD